MECKISTTWQPTHSKSLLNCHVRNSLKLICCQLTGLTTVKLCWNSCGRSVIFTFFKIKIIFWPILYLNFSFFILPQSQNFQSHLGFKGVVRDAVTGKPVKNAVVWVRNVTASNTEAPIKHPVTTGNSLFINSHYNLRFSGRVGDYFRPLIDGSYQVAIDAEGYEPAMRVVNITNAAHKEAQRVDFLLRPVQQAVEEEQMPIEEQQYIGQTEPAEDYRLTPEQADQMAELIEYARKNNIQPLYN